MKPTFTERPVIRQSDEGNKIIFECRLVGEPVPEVSWFHNDKALSETGRHKFTMQLDEKLYHLCRLEINNVDSADAGCYKAVAKNASGEGQATINLTFEEGTFAPAVILLLPKTYFETKYYYKKGKKFYNITKCFYRNEDKNSRWNSSKIPKETHN